MATISALNRCTSTDPQYPPHAFTSHNGQEWTIRRMRRDDVSAVTLLFRRLHAFNTALDSRFALSDEWETRFTAAIQKALCADGSLCLIVREMGTDRPCGFALAAVHHDSDLWRYHEWVEVEALFVDESCRGHGLGEALLDLACAWAESIDQAVVQLYVTASNDRAIQFYRHEGFRETQAIMRRVLFEEATVVEPSPLRTA